MADVTPTAGDELRWAATVDEVPEERAKYKQADRDKMAKSGEAMPDGSYPIADREDVQNAIHAVGRGNANHDAIRKHIIARAKALGCSDMIPDNWNSDGSLKQANAADGDLERRKRVAESLMRRTVERRHADTGPIEIREGSDGKLNVGGYASVFDRPYDMGFYSESVKRGAFAKTLREGAQVHLLLNHAGLPLASTLNDTLHLREDAIGLRWDATLDPEDPDSQAAIRKIRSGLLQQCSFAFQPIRQTWNTDYTERALDEVSIDRGDVSIVNFGASPHTSVATRGALEDFERSAVRFALDLIEQEERAGATFSSSNMTKLKAILGLVADADKAVDQAQEDLSSLIGVKNPDDDHEAPAERAAVVVPLVIPDYSAQAKAALARARRSA